MFLGMLTYWILTIIPPCFAFIYDIINSENISITDTNAMIPSFEILTIENNLVILILNFLMQIITYTLQLMVIGTWLILKSCAFVHISYELKLLGITILNIYSDTKRNNELGTTTVLSKEENDLNLKLSLQNIHGHHLRIIE